MIPRLAPPGVRLNGVAENCPRFSFLLPPPTSFLGLAKFGGLGACITAWALNWVLDRGTVVEPSFF